MSRRIERLNEQFKRELMDILRNHVRDPRVADLTVTRAEVAPDLYNARIFLTTMRPDADRPEALVGLEAATPFIRGELARRLTIRRTPELEFRWDLSLDHARRIEQLLSEVRQQGEAADGDRPEPTDENPEPADDG